MPLSAASLQSAGATLVATICSVGAAVDLYLKLIEIVSDWYEALFAIEYTARHRKCGGAEDVERLKVETVDQRESVRANGRFLLPRLHAFEFTDQVWLPNTVRSIVTDAIGEAFKVSVMRSGRSWLPSFGNPESSPTSWNWPQARRQLRFY